jgi:hypothetical protein
VVKGVRLSDRRKLPVDATTQPSRPYLAQDGILTPQLYLLLSTAIEMLGAQKGNIQFYDARRRALRIVAQIGFNEDFLNAFATVRPGEAACGFAFKYQQRIIIENVWTDNFFSYLVPFFEEHGLAAVQSTPLFDSRGKVFAVLSTHFNEPRRPTDEQLNALDNYLKKAVPIILRRKQAVKMTLLQNRDLLKEPRAAKDSRASS